jgi:hypothetical protein
MEITKAKPFYIENQSMSTKFQILDIGNDGNKMIILKSLEQLRADRKIKQ